MTNRNELSNDLTNFHSVLMSISFHYKPVSEDAIKDYLGKMERILTAASAIDDEFDPVACGAFKECYSLNDDFVIKFASECNDTDAEQYLLQAAVEAGVAEVFMPTWYCPLTFSHPSLYMLNDEDSYRWYYNENYHTYVENSNYTGQCANYAIIQPRIRCTVGDGDYINLPRNAHDYAQAPIVDEDGNEVDFRTAYSFCVSSQTWLQDIVDAYGIEFFRRLADFLDDNNVHDLHTGNIGYYQRNDGKVVPVIFDCLSSCR